jgi:hypothetical protein
MEEKALLRLKRALARAQFGREELGGFAQGFVHGERMR